MLALFETIHSWIRGFTPDQTTRKVLNMSNVNYTPEMVKILEQNAPVDYAKAQDLAKQLDRGVRSIIAKCKREGIEYIYKPAPAKKKAAATKVELVAAHIVIEVIGWIGAAVMVAASFNMARPLGLKMAIVGLSLLTIQAYSSDTYNLIVLNLSSIIGFTLSLMRKGK